MNIGRIFHNTMRFTMTIFKFSHKFDGSPKFIPIMATCGICATGCSKIPKWINISDRKHIRNVVELSDHMLKNEKFDSAYVYLKSHCSDPNTVPGQSPDLLWRLSRAAYEKAKKSIDNDQHRFYVLEAVEYAKRALKLDVNLSEFHGWFSDVVDVLGKENADELMKPVIDRAFEVQSHLLKAYYDVGRVDVPANERQELKILANHLMYVYSLAHFLE